jgi:uracil-DNA glycosylase family 4
MSFSTLHQKVSRAKSQLALTYLQRELAIVQPKLVIGLGKDAEKWLRRYANMRPLIWSVDLSPTGLTEIAYLFVYHPAYFMYRGTNQQETMYIKHLASAIRWAFNT